MKGQNYPADPPTVDEIVAVMRQAENNRHGDRVTALIVVLWRAVARRAGANARRRDPARSIAARKEPAST